MFLRLCSRAPCTVSVLPLPRRRRAGAAISRAPERYWPVSEAGLRVDLGRRAGGHELAAQASGAGPEIDDVIGALDGFGVVLDHEHGVAEIAQAHERVEQAVVVARVQADGRLVEHVQHAAELRSDLRGQAYALRFAAGERGGGAVQAQVIEADGGEEVEPVADLFEHARRRSAARVR